MFKLTDVIQNGLLDTVKRQLSVSWDDVDTDAKIFEMMQDAEATLNHVIGAEVDYAQPGMERRLFLNFMLYAWNDCLDEFDKSYLAEIYKVRHKYEVEASKEDA